MADPRAVAVVVVALLVVGIVVIYGGVPLGPPPSDTTSGDLSFTFYDENGNPITSIAFISSGQEISGFTTDFSVSATGSVPLTSGNLGGSYGYKIYGIDEFDQERILKTSELGTLNINDYSNPIGWTGDWYTSISILEPYDNYRDKGGWKVLVYVDADVTATNSDSESLSGSWYGEAYFYVWWQAGTLQLTGEISA